VQFRRGDIWLVDFEPVEGHEQGGQRPAVLLTNDAVDVHKTELVFVIPGTRTARINLASGAVLRDVLQVVPTKENGLKSTTYFLCGKLRVVSLRRLSGKRLGRLSEAQMYEIEDILIFLLDLAEKD
jgi:mRNA interferase MazF